MCGRFTLRAPAHLIIERFRLTGLPEFGPRFNIAPTQPVPVVRLTTDLAARELSFLYWGLVPSWAKDTTIGSRLINARGETVAEKPSFRAAFKRRRCLVIADGYYEWKKIGTKKQPFLIAMPDDQPFAMAGLWESWHGGDGPQQGDLQSCTIITTAANDTTCEVHDRMPVILDESDWDAWLDPNNENTSELHERLTPWSGPALTLRPVSTQVNNPRHDGPDVLVAP